MNGLTDTRDDHAAPTASDAVAMQGGRKRRMSAGTSFAVAGLGLFALAGAGVFWTVANPAGATSSTAERAEQRRVARLQRDLDALSVDNAEQIVVEGVEAQARNALVPMAKGALEHASSFAVADEENGSGRTAVRCLTQAIYYEAGFEPLQGRRAVAQVVLNRVAHPAYPNSVCGVVYQGSNRRTGCQFSFTCDGSLLRAPAPGAWREAEKIARAALAGAVEPSVGTSTHYHADYVLPKWAFTLGKLQQIGRHIFYRFRGRAGSASAFTARYAGFEAIPSMDFAQLRERALEEGELLAQGELTPGLTVAPHVTDRHASNDVGGRLDVRTEWRLTIPDPVKANAHFADVVSKSAAGAAPALPHPAASGRVAVAEQPKVAGIAVP